MKFFPAYLYFGGNQVKPIVIGWADGVLSIYKDCLPVYSFQQHIKFSYDQKTEFLFRIKEKQLFIFISPFRDQIIQTMQQQSVESIRFFSNSVGQIICQNKVIFIQNVCYEYDSIQIVDNVASLNSEEIVLEGFYNQMLLEHIRFHQSYTESSINQLDESTLQLQFSLKPDLFINFLDNLLVDDNCDIFSVDEIVSQLNQNQNYAELLLQSNQKYADIVLKYGIEVFSQYLENLNNDNGLKEQFQQIDKEFGQIYNCIYETHLIQSQKQTQQSPISNSHSLKSTTSLLSKSQVFKDQNNQVQTNAHIEYNQYPNNYQLIKQSIKSLKTEELAYILINDKLQQVKFSLNPIFDFQDKIEFYFSQKRNERILFNGNYIKFSPCKVIELTISDLAYYKQFDKKNKINPYNSLQLISNQGEKFIVVFEQNYSQFLSSLQLLLSYISKP